MPKKKRKYKHTCETTTDTDNGAIQMMDHDHQMSSGIPQPVSELCVDITDKCCRKVNKENDKDNIEFGDLNYKLCSDSQQTDRQSYVKNCSENILHNSAAKDDMKISNVNIQKENESSQQMYVSEQTEFLAAASAKANKLRKKRKRKTCDITRRTQDRERKRRQRMLAKQDALCAKETLTSNSQHDSDNDTSVSELDKRRADIEAYYVAKYNLIPYEGNECSSASQNINQASSTRVFNKDYGFILHIRQHTDMFEMGASNVDSGVENLSSKQSNKLKQKQHERLRYHMDPVYRNKKKDYAKKKYKEDELYRHQKISHSSQRYRTNRQYRGCLKNASIIKYRENILHRTRVIHSGLKKYRMSIQYKKQLRNASIQKYKYDIEHQKRIKQASISKYSGDKKFRQKVKDASSFKYRTDSQHRQRVKDASSFKYRTDSRHRETVKDASSFKYRTDSQHRQKVQDASSLNLLKYRSDRQYRQNVILHNKLMYRQSASHRDKDKKRLQHQYKTDTTVRNKKIKKVKMRRRQKQDKSDIVKFFQEEVRNGPKFVCCVCQKIKFRKQVIECVVDKYNNTRSSKVMAKRCISYKYAFKCTENCENDCEILHHKKLWICYTCHRHLLKGNMPPDATANNLQLKPVPEALGNLNTLERQLLSLRLPFMKLVRLPKGGQKGVIGPCVSVPTDIEHTTKILPRCTDDAELVRVKLKRKLPYKGHYQYEYISPAKLRKGLNVLQENNSWYADTSFDETWENPISKPSDSCEQTEIPNDSSLNIETDTAATRTSELVHDNSADEDDDPSQHYRGVSFDTCLQPIDIGQEVLDQYFDKIFCVAPAEGNTPVSLLRELGNEAMSFPVQFPDGTNTYDNERTTRLSRTRYFHSRLLNADRRFSSDSHYIFYAQYLSELEQVISQVSIALRKGTSNDHSGKPITADMLTNPETVKNLIKSDQGYKFLTPVRGTPPYWQSTLKDLFAMIRQLGIPTWFCTFSAADMRWTEIIQILLEQQGSTQIAEDLDYQQKCEVLQNNALMSAISFDHRFHTLLKLILDQQIIGEVKDHFHRIEFQQRGSPHSHCLFWINDAPLLDKDNDEIVCAFIDKYVSCRLPAEDDAELYEIVESVQKHSKNHSKTCKKKGTDCRFHFPRPPSERTFISRPHSLTDPSTDASPQQMMNTAKDTLRTLWEVINHCNLDEITTQNIFAAAGITQSQFEEASNILTKRTSVVLERTPTDSWINQYNPDLLRCWNANMDIQYITDPYSCVMYIISYISKAEKEMGVILEDAKKEAAEGNCDAQEAMKKIGGAYFRQREVSAQEAVYRVCGLHLKECSRKIQFIPVGNDQVKMSKPLHLIQKQSSESDDDIWMPTVSERYRARPQTCQFDHLCLAKFCSDYRVLAVSQIPKDVGKNPQVHELQNNLGFIRKRSRTDAAVVRYPRFSPKKDPELYYKSILQLFLPHRKEEQLKPPKFHTYEEFYVSGAVKVASSSDIVSVKSIVDSNQQVFEHNAEALDEAEELMQKLGPLEDAWAMIAPESELNRLESKKQKVSVSDDEETLEIPDLDPKPKAKDQCIQITKSILTSEEAKPLLRSLNEKQKQIFYFVRQWCIDKVNRKNPEPFRLFVTGGAGTGKSHLIKCLHYQAQKILAPAASNPDDVVVLLTAPTGTAAFNIGGTTIHQAFTLPQYMTLSYQPLREETLNTLRCKLQNLAILIIDEISMVGQEVLLYISERLRQIKQSGNALFGNICVIAVGDFYQLPPVKQKRLYDLRPKNLFSLWSDNFSLIELNEIMRQRDDAPFAELLNRLRLKQKEDQLALGDKTSLESCQNKDIQLETLHIFATNNEVDNHNRIMIEKACESYQILQAQDYDKHPRTGKLIPKQTPYATSSDFLPQELSLGKGARVMLVRNVDISDGLVNGVVGTVLDILPPPSGSSFPAAILVTFDNNKIGQKQRQSYQAGELNKVVIKPVEETLNNNAVRLQFPLRLAWACTVHKVQGITTDNLVVSFKKIFAAGMAYVALSRVTALQGLAIQDFDAAKIYCIPQVSEALQRMKPFVPPSTGCVLDERSFHILLHNIQGLIPHIIDLKSNTDVADAHFICLTETWTQPHTDIQSLPNHDFHHKPRAACYNSSQILNKLQQQKNGGVGYFVKHDQHFEQVPFDLVNIEAIAFHVTNIKTTFVIMYRPETYTLSAFIKNLRKLLKHLPDDEDLTTVVMGDFNQDLMKSNKSIQNFMATVGFQQLVQQPTTDGGTLIDHVYIKGNASVTVHVCPTYYSYHNMISLQFQKN